MKKKIILADDHTVIREGLRIQIEQLPDMEVIAEADNGRTAVRQAAELAPDVVIMDISMSGLNGIQATRHIINECPGVKVVALSMHSDRRYVTQMLRAGASGYILKVSAFREIADAIRSVFEGQTYLSPKIAGYVVEGFLSSNHDAEGGVQSILTPRECEVLQLIAESKTTKEAAALLHLSARTVETYRHNIMNKLDIHDIAGLTKFAIKEGLVSLDS